METQELHRGRLIDHIQLVVRDLAASRSFYTAVFDALNVPMGGTAEDYEDRTVDELKSRAKELGLKGYSDKRKSELISMLRDH